MAIQWSFAGYIFPIQDSPTRGNSGDWNVEEKLVEHDPLNANVTVLTTWGRKSARRIITGTCNATTRDQMRTFQAAGTVGTLEDAEERQFQARLIRADFTTLLPGERYTYTLEFLER